MKNQLTEIEAMASQYGDIADVKREIRNVQTLKTRLKKNKFAADYSKKMQDVLAYEQSLKEVRALLQPKGTPVTMFTQADVDLLDYDQTVRAKKSIQSKKTNTAWLTDTQYDNDEYRNAVRIETMLNEHLALVKPVEETYIRKSDLQTVIDTIESTGKISTSRIVELLKDLL